VCAFVKEGCLHREGGKGRGYRACAFAKEGCAWGNHRWAVRDGGLVRRRIVRLLDSSELFQQTTGKEGNHERKGSRIHSSNGRGAE
jgi:hypothetical protein